MIWDGPLIAKLLELYKKHPVLWDPKHEHYSDKIIRQMSLQEIQEELDLPISAADIHRKYKTMRAAYQVEVRKINTANVRGFFYKPSLHWFPIFQKFIDETKDAIAIKAKEQAKKERVFVKSLQHEYGDKIENAKKRLKTSHPSPKESNSNVQVVPEVASEPSDEELSSEESDDEFQTFADHIAEQLRSMSVHRAVMIQNKIQRLFTKDRETHEDDAEDFELP